MKDASFVQLVHVFMDEHYLLHQFYSDVFSFWSKHWETLFALSMSKCNNNEIFIAIIQRFKLLPNYMPELFCELSYKVTFNSISVNN